MKKETGADVFESWDESFADPLGMQDWRLSDGYYHYERDKSQYPAYPFRLSARDAARFGLLFAREGVWGDERILSRNWVRRSTALYSIDDDVFGYGFMWWVAREPRFQKYGFYTASGVGNQKIAVIPDLDMVIVNRANTYRGERTPLGPLLDLMEQVLLARTGDPVDSPSLKRLARRSTDDVATRVPNGQLADMAGTWDYPPPLLGMPKRTTVDIKVGDGHLVTYSEVSGTFKHYLQDDGSFIEEDSHDRYLPLRDDDGTFVGIVTPSAVVDAAVLAAAQGEKKLAKQHLGRVDGMGVAVDVGRPVVDAVNGKKGAEKQLRAIKDRLRPFEVARRVDNFAGMLQDADLPDAAERLFLLNTRLYPDIDRPWERLGDLQAELDKHDEAIAAFRKVLEIAPDNPRAQGKIDAVAERRN